MQVCKAEPSVYDYLIQQQTHKDRAGKRLQLMIIIDFLEMSKCVTKFAQTYKLKIGNSAKNWAERMLACSNSYWKMQYLYRCLEGRKLLLNEHFKLF